MATEISTYKELEYYFASKIMSELLRRLAEECVELMKKELKTAQRKAIRTETLREYITIKYTQNDATIYVDYNAISQFEESPPLFSGGTLVAWGRFTNTFSGAGGLSGVDIWNGKLVSFRMLEWLESGGAGHLGNQPITATHWFTNTESKIKENLDDMVKKHLRKIGIKF